LDDFHFVEINGLKVLEPNQAYAMLWEALTGERVTPLHAAPLLDAAFKKAGPGRVPWYPHHPYCPLFVFLPAYRFTTPRYQII
jgi:hypothetical protein